MNIGRYQILEEIGKGSMGIVYKARDPNLDLTVALKVLRKDRLANEAIVRRFMAEARALGRLDHPNIVRVFNVERDGEEVYIAMEYIQGESFSSLISSNKLTAENIAETGATIAEALDYAHKKGIVHRDVKPSNILFTHDGRLKITDFGIAHIEDSSLEETQAGEILGTPAYMSPEQVLSQPVDGRSDLFSLGIILYEIAAGVRPFSGKGMNAIFHSITAENPVAVHVRNPEVSKELSAVIMKSLNKSPAARFVDGIEMAAQLRAAAAPVRSAVPGTAVAGPAKESRKYAYLAGGVLVLFVVAGTLLFTYFSGNTSPPAADQAVKESAGAVPVPAAQGQALLDAVTTPPGATIIVDGVHKGVSPAKIPLSAGKHEIRIVLTGFEAWAAQVEFEKDATMPLALELIPQK